MFQGRAVVNTPTKHEIELCHYTGTLRGRPGSWAALSTCRPGTIEGVVFDGLALHHVQRSEQDDLHYMYNLVLYSLVNPTVTKVDGKHEFYFHM